MTDTDKEIIMARMLKELSIERPISQVNISEFCDEPGEDTMLTMEEIVKRIRKNELHFTRDELDDLFMIVDNPLGNLEVNWDKQKVRLKGLHVEFTFGKNSEE